MKIQLNILNKIIYVGLISSYCFLSYIKIFTIPPHIGLLIIGLLINFKYLKFELISTSNFKYYALFLSFLLVVFNSFLYNDNLNNVLDIVKFGVIPLFIFIYISMIIKVIGLNFILKTFIYIISINVLLAFFQFCKFTFAWNIREYLSTFSDINQSLELKVKMSEWILAGTHPMGLAYHSVNFSYQVLILAALISSNYFFYKSNNLLKLFIYLSLLVSHSRSVVFGFILGLSVTKQNILFSKFYIKILIFSILFFIFFVILTIDSSTFSRITHSYIGLNILLDNLFFGIGNGNYLMQSKPYFDNLYNHGIYFPSYLRNEAVHNSFLFAFIKFGIQLFPIMIGAYYLIISKILSLRTINFKLSNFFTIYIVSYSAHSFFHNQGIFTGDQLFWVITSILFATPTEKNEK